MKKYIVNVNGTKYEITLEIANDAEATAPAAAPAKQEAAPAPVKQEAAPAAPAGANGEKINSPMPGTILDVKVASGDVVKKGQVLFILEAMKMENEIMSPVDGKVTVLTQKGATVESGAPLCTIE